MASGQGLPAAAEQARSRATARHGLRGPPALEGRDHRTWAGHVGRQEPTPCPDASGRSRVVPDGHLSAYAGFNPRAPSSTPGCTVTRANTPSQPRVHSLRRPSRRRLTPEGAGLGTAAEAPEEGSASSSRRISASLQDRGHWLVSWPSDSCARTLGSPPTRNRRTATTACLRDYRRQRGRSYLSVALERQRELSDAAREGAVLNHRAFGEYASPRGHP
jgi:hypothetical protein